MEKETLINKITPIPDEHPEKMNNTTPTVPIQKVAIEIRGLRAGYGHGDILKGVNMSLLENHITAIIGPSGCGKSTLIRCMNRMHEIHVGATNSGDDGGN